jgi:pSer/pThr/pTyr-binding forkhead associated (FHA) protein
MAETGWKCQLCEAVIPRDKPQGCVTCGYRVYSCKNCGHSYPAFLGRCPECAALCDEAIPPENLVKLRRAFPSVFGVAPISQSDAELDAVLGSIRNVAESMPSSEQDERFSTRVDKPAQKLSQTPSKKSDIAIRIEENGDCPVAIQMESPRPLDDDLSGQLRIRLKPYIPDAGFNCELNVKGTALAKPIHNQARIGSSIVSLPNIAFRADSPGLYLLRISFLLNDVDGETLGRWITNVSLYVEEEGDKTSCRVEGETLPTSLGLQEEVEPSSGNRAWRTVRLKRDRHFDQTVRRTPGDKFPPPPDFFGRGAGPAGVKGHGLIVVRDSDGEHRLVAQVGEQMLLGRSNVSDHGNHIPLRSQSADVEQSSRISRAHAIVELANNRAYLRPVGRNYTALNGLRVNNDERHQLQDGDDISLAGSIDFKVRLWVIHDSVVAVRLIRKDNLRGKLGYLLVLGETPFPWTSETEAMMPEPVFWGAFASNSAGEIVLLRYSEQKSDWLPVRTHESAVGHQTSVRWIGLFDKVREQETYLQAHPESPEKPAET